MSFAALDTNQNSTPAIPCLKTQGITAIGRYYTRDRSNSKILGLDEARRLSEAGIKIWAVYQNRHRLPADFSAVKGKQEAEDALDYAMHVIKQPARTGVFFSVDFDVSQAVYDSAIHPHFRAIAVAFAAAGNPYRIGVYGSGAVCKSLLDAGLVELAWLSQSRGFRGTPDFMASRRWNILQALPVKGFCGFDDDVDPNTLNTDIGDFGGFLLDQIAARQFVGGGAMDAAAAVPAPQPDVPPVPPFRGRALHRGDLGSDDVEILQARLNDLGFGRLIVDGDFGEATQNAVLHFQARNSTPDGKPLSIDGEVDASTWASLFGPGAVFESADFDRNRPMPDLVIDIAASQVGVVEQPRGSNRGPEVDAYIRAAGLDPARDSFPWCVCFLYWVFGQAALVKGIENPLPQTAGVIALWNLAGRTKAQVVHKSEVSARSVKPGMIFLLDLGGGKGHAGLVIEVRGDDVITIEGNTNPGGSSEGFGVFRRETRPLRTSVLLGYLDFCEV